MKKYCSVCFRKISINKNGRICRHGFKKNRWIINDFSSIENHKYKKVDSSPCPGSGKIGIKLRKLTNYEK